MNKMKMMKNYTDKEWEELASLLSDEKVEKTDLLVNYISEDMHNTGKQWNELKEMSDEKEINVNKAWANLNLRLDEEGLKISKAPSKINLMRRSFVRIAAVALILLSIGYSVLYLNNSDFFSKKIVLVTGNDQKNLLVALPDGSKIFLNRNTEISYHANFGKQKREVTLSGEAFLEITADASKPFILDAGNAKVTVVGTSFNVITKNGKSEVEVYVKTGKVILSDNSRTQNMVLDPGIIGTISSIKSEKTLNTDPNYLSWNSGLLVYNGQKLDVVFRDLKRVYNMEIVTLDPAILNYAWTSPIDNQPQDTIIRLICASFNLSYLKDGNVYHLTRK